MHAVHTGGYCQVVPAPLPDVEVTAIPHLLRIRIKFRGTATRAVQYARRRVHCSVHRAAVLYGQLRF